MARLTGPDQSERMFYYTSGSRKGQLFPAGTPVPLYADSLGTQPADVTKVDGSAVPLVGGFPTVYITSTYEVDLFKFPDVEDPVVYTSVGGGPIVALHPRTDDRVDALKAQVEDLDTSSVAYTDEALANAVTILPASNGTDDTAVVNAALAAAAGKRVVGRHGQNYQMTAPPVVWSDTVLDMRGCTLTIKSGSHCNLINNRAVSQARRVTDAATTSGSATLFSATAAFASGDVGKTVVVHGAGASGALLTTTISAVTNSTTATMATTAGTTTSSTYAAIGNRDRNITVIGGTWIRQDNNNGSANGWDKHNFRFRHVDGLKVIDPVIQTTEGKYAVSLGDVTDAVVVGPRLSAFSDGVHIQGPAYRTAVIDVRGTTGDDSVAVTPRDWPAYDDCFGHVEDTLIQNVTATSTAACAVKVLGGSTATAARRTVVEKVAGTSVNHAVYIGDDIAQANTTGGLVQDCTVRDVRTVSANAVSAVYVGGRNLSRIRVNGVEWSNASGTAPVIWYTPGVTATLDSLIVTDIRVASLGAIPVLRCDLSGTVSRLRMSGIDVGASASGADILHVRGAVTDLILRDVEATLNNSNIVSLGNSDAAATITRGTISGIQAVGAGASLLRATLSTHALPRLEVSDVQITGFAWLGDLATATELHMANVTHLSPTGGLLNVRATAALTIKGAGFNLALGGSNINIASGGTVTSKTFALECDIDDLQLTANSMAYNTNAGKACGVGPVVSNGTNWKHIYTGATS